MKKIAIYRLPFLIRNGIFDILYVRIILSQWCSIFLFPIFFSYSIFLFYANIFLLTLEFSHYQNNTYEIHTHTLYKFNTFLFYQQFIVLFRRFPDFCPTFVHTFFFKILFFLYLSLSFSFLVIKTHNFRLWFQSKVHQFSGLITLTSWKFKSKLSITAGWWMIFSSLSSIFEFWKNYNTKFS